MTRWRIWGLMALTGLVLAAGTAGAQWKPSTNAEFDRIKTLVGEWKGTAKEGPRVESSWKMISSGSALMETLRLGNVEMVTVFHPYGDRLMCTHYCASNTQPRLVTRRKDPPADELRFEFLDATNMMNANSMSVDALTLRFRTTGTYQEEWRSPNKKEPPTIIEFERKQ